MEGEGRFVQLSFSAELDTVSHSGPLYKLRFIGVAGQFYSIVVS